MLSVSSINIGQTAVVENALVMEDYNYNTTTYKIFKNTNNDKVSFCEQVESNDLSSTVGDTAKKRVRFQKSNLVSKQQVMLCRLRLTVLMNKRVRVQKSTPTSK